jgi:4-carboxymuconolactone decarboxylase
MGTKSMAETRTKALELIRSMLGDETGNALEACLGSTGFGLFRGEMTVDFVYGKLWPRPGLDHRSRSLVTVAMLIALNQPEELKIHLIAALNNGCTVTEIEEVIYHSAAYAGFPASNRAAHVATELFRQRGLIESGDNMPITANRDS